MKNHLFKKLDLSESLPWMAAEDFLPMTTGSSNTLCIAGFCRADLW